MKLVKKINYLKNELLKKDCNPIGIKNISKLEIS